MNTGRETFHKTERLCSRKIFCELFEKGNILYTPAFKVVWYLSRDLIPSPAQVAFSVSKRTFKKAVDRNLIKRRMRETYRKMKPVLYDFLAAGNKQLVFIVVYRWNKIADYETIRNAMNTVLDKLMVQVRENMTKS